MIYIYDIMLNFNDKLIEFFEWEDSDDVIYAKKVVVIGVSSKVISDLINYKVKVDKNFSNLICNKSNIYDDTGISQIAILSDGKMALGIKIDNNIVVGISRLLLDEELDVLKLVGRVPETIITYEILDKKEISNDNNLTRSERKIIRELSDEFTNLYNNNRIDKLNYYYYEYFNEKSNDKEHVYHSLLNSINNDFNKKHILLYDIIKLSYHNNINI